MKKRIIQFLLFMVLTLSVVSCGKIKIIKDQVKDESVSISFAETEVLMLVGETKDIPADVKLGEYVFNFKLTYALSNDNAVVDEDGNVTAVKEGFVTLTATGNDKDKTQASIEIEILAKPLEVYTIEYNLDGGQNPSGAVTSFNERETVTLPIPTKEGYRFLGWYEGETKVTETVEKKNYSVTAKWAEEYTVTFKADGVVVDTAIYVVGDEAVTEPSVPTKAHYENGRWEAYTLDGGNKVVNAVYDAVEYTVTFKADGTECGTQTYTVENTTITEPSVPAKAHYENGRWEVYTLDGGNKVVNAVYDAVEYTVTFKAEGVEVAVVTYTIEDETLVEPQVPAKAHYENGRWEVYTLDGGNKVSNALYDAIKYDVKLVLAGGAYGEVTTIAAWADIFMADFNAAAGTTVAKETFVGDTTTAIKTAISNETFYNKYQWLFEFAYDELARNTNGVNDSAYKDTMAFLEAIKADYETANAMVNNGSVPGPNGRTCLRVYLEGLLNETLNDTKPSYAAYCPDYSKAENVAKFWDAYLDTEIELTVEDTLPVAARIGYKFLGWYVEGTKVEKVTSNCTLTAMWEAIPYTVTYDLAEGNWDSVEGETSFVYNEFIELVEPVKEGYKFLGWYEGETKVTEITENRNYTLTAHWEYITSFEVTFDLAGGKFEGKYDSIEEFATEFIADFNAAAGTTVVKESFAKNTATAIKTAVSNETFYDKYQWLFEFAYNELVAANPNAKDAFITDTIQFLEALKTDYETANAMVNNGAAPGPNGRTCFRNYLDGLLNEKLSEAYASYTPYCVDYSKAENQARFFTAVTPATTQTIERNQTLPTPVNGYYEFLGWYIGETKVETVTSDCTLTAKWGAPTKFEISYDANGGTVAKDVVVFEDATEVILETPTRAGYEFVGWYEGTTKVESISENRNYELVAEWKQVTTTVSYNLNGGSVNADYTFVVDDFNSYNGTDLGKYTTLNRSQNRITYNAFRIYVTYNASLGLYEAVSAAAAGTKWANDSATWNDSKMLTSADYVLAGFNGSGQYDAASRDTIAALVNLVLSGTKVYFDFGTIPSANTHTWNRSVKAYLNPELAAGKPITYTENTNSLPSAQKAGYTFDGWYANAEFTGEKLTAITVGATSTSMNLYAKFTAVEYTISYDLGEGAANVTLVEKYTIETDTIVLPTADQMSIADGTFEGWYLNGEKVTTIAKGSMGNIELVANWTMNYAQDLEISDADATALNALYTASSNEVATLLVNASLTGNGKYVLTNANLTSGYTDVEYVMGTNLFASLADAIAKAEAGDIIYVFAGSYTTAFTVAVDDLTIVGPNYGIAGTDENRNAEATIKAQITVTANGLTLDGLAFNGTSTAVVVSADIDGITLNNAKAHSAYKTITGGTGQGYNNSATFYAFLWSNSSVTVSNVVVANSSFYMDQALGYVPVSIYKVNNIKVINNKMQNSSTYGYALGLRIPTGVVEIVDNTVIWATGGYTFRIDDASGTTSILIKDNYFNKSVSTGRLNELRILNAPVIYVIGNEFNALDGGAGYNDFSFDNSGKVYIKYNFFDTTSSNLQIGASSVEFANNYYAAANSNSDYSVTYTNEQREIDYLSDNTYNPTTAYTITLDAKGGEVEYTSKAACINHEFVLPTPTKSGYDFLGWSKVEGSTDYITSLNQTTNEDVTLYANWAARSNYTVTYDADLGTISKESDSFLDYETIVLPTPTAPEGFEFAGWYEGETLVEALTENRDYQLVAKYNHTTPTTLEVGSDKYFTTLEEALAIAISGDVIKVASGTYSADITINVNNITIEGPNKGVAGTATRNAEATVTGAITIKASNVTINGLGLSGTSTIALDGASNLVLTNIYSNSEGNADTTDIYGGVISSTDSNAASSNVTISNCYFFSAATSGVYHAVALYGKVTNVTIIDSKIKNSLPSATGNSDAIRMNNIAGEVIIKSNVIDFATNNWDITVGATANSASKIVVRDNTFTNAVNTCGSEIRNVAANAVVDYVGNICQKVTGSTLSFPYAAGTSTINIKYNNFTTGTTYKMNSVGTATIVYYGNSYAQANYNNANSNKCDYSTRLTNAEREIAYLSDKTYNPETAYTITLDVDGGTIDSTTKAACINKEIALPTPEKAGYDFLGWTLVKGSTEYISSINQTTATDITVYANWALETPKVTLNANGGTFEIVNTDLGTAKKEYIITYYNAILASDYSANNAGNIFLGDSSSYKSNYTYRAYLGYDEVRGCYYVISTHTYNTASDWASGAVYMLMVPGSGTNDSNSGFVVGDCATISYIPTENGLLDSANYITVSFYDKPVDTKVDTYKYEASKLTSLPTPERGGFIFLGWYNGETKVTDTDIATLTSSVSLTAQWEEVAEASDLVITAQDAAALNAIYTDKAKAPTILVNASAEAGKYVLANTSLNSEVAAVEYISGVNLFENITDALNTAQANDVIYVFAGTYAATVTISKTGIVLAGPNYGIDGNATRGAEADITGRLIIGDVSNVTVNGIKMSGGSSSDADLYATISYGASDNLKLLNNYIVQAHGGTGDGTTGYYGNNRGAMINQMKNKTATGVIVSNNYIDCSTSKDSVRIIMAVNSGKDVTFTYNTLVGTTYNGHGLYCYNSVTGTVNFYGNTTGYGYYAAKATVVTTAPAA